MKPSSLSLLALALASTVLTALPAATPVSAQELQPGETVLERRRPEVEQLGIRAGSFRILPRIETGLTYESNVFATENDTRDDFIWVTQPRVDVRSDFNNHALNFSASGNIGRFFDYSSENYADYRAQVDGRYDITRDSSVSGLLFSRRDHEGRSDPNFDVSLATGTVVPRFAEPVNYFTHGGEASFNQRFNRLRVRLTGGAQYTSYQDAELTNGRTESQEDRDRWSYTGTARAGYEFIQGYEAFVQGSYNWTRYRLTPDFGGVNRDSDGYEVVGGLSTDLTGLINGEIYAGYLSRTYDDPTLKDFGGLALGGRLNWSVTQLTSVTGSLSRQVRESTYARGSQIASSYNRTVAAVGVDHELLRTLLLNARVQWRQDDFNGVDRTDDVYTLGAGASYQLSRYVFVNGGYTYEKRNSNLSGFDYSDNLVYLRVGAQM
ncbi:outer membrane beta-barrel protein [Azospirillum argentinense]